ncbi:rhamnosyltransferase [Streptococcus rupicaprae]|uniref:Rhamnosyltransferase n=1 Tax=Streptococcus rupicaprae TaxID=759619 RepID=A0ABV2FG44_9STRE
MRHVFIIGSRGLPATYGGFETFVAELVKHQQSQDLKYHVACLTDGDPYQHFDYAGADCFTINPPKLGPARVIAYDMLAIRYALKLVKEEAMEAPIFYLLGNTIGGMIAPFAKQIRAVGGMFFINPDGLEWKRSKWPKPVQAYLKYAEKMMTKHADLVIADNRGIETYLKEAYPWSRTTFLAYGTDLTPSSLTAQAPSVREFYQRFETQEKGYYLILGRFVPENNYETSIREFMASSTQRKLLIIANYQGNAYWQTLAEKTGFRQDPRVVFVGTIYDQELLKYIRQSAFAYIHGHEVGGTNPSLLESLAQTDLNLVLDVSFNRQVALDTAYYWTKAPGSLSGLINTLDAQVDHEVLGQKARANMQNHYTWEAIVAAYEELFLS